MSTTARKKTSAANAASGAKETLDAVSDTAAKQFKENVEKVNKGVAELGDFTKENLEASVESATTLAKVVEEISSENMSFVKKTYEEGVETMKILASATSPQEIFEAQNVYLRSIFDTQASQMAKMSDLALSASKEVSDPLRKRYTALVDMVQSYRA